MTSNVAQYRHSSTDLCFLQVGKQRLAVGCWGRHYYKAASNPVRAHTQNHLHTIHVVGAPRPRRMETLDLLLLPVHVPLPVHQSVLVVALVVCTGMVLLLGLGLGLSPAPHQRHQGARHGGGRHRRCTARRGAQRPQRLQRHGLGPAAPLPQSHIQGAATDKEDGHTRHLYSCGCRTGLEGMLLSSVLVPLRTCLAVPLGPKHRHLLACPCVPHLMRLPFPAPGAGMSGLRACGARAAISSGAICRTSGGPMGSGGEAGAAPLAVAAVKELLLASEWAWGRCLGS